MIPSSRRIDLTGREFGLLTALFPDGANTSGHSIWICGCSCGNPERQEFTSRELVHLGTDSCGCRPRRLRKDGRSYRKYARVTSSDPDGMYITHKFKGPGNRTHLTLSNRTTEMISVVANIRRISVRTIDKRILEYGLHSPLVLYSGTISQSVIDDMQSIAPAEPVVEGIEFSKPPVSKKTHGSKHGRWWDRSKCRRDGINCVGYSECQARRCGIGPRFAAPANTDKCYRAPKIIRNLFPSALAALCNFGVFYGGR